VLDQVEKAMPKGMVLNRDPFRASSFIERSVNNVVKVLIEASVIVAVILILFLLNVRATIVTLTALPLSLAVAILLLWAWGLSINVMTLGGLAVAIGELVDDAIIDVENVLRRLKENAGLPEGERKGRGGGDLQRQQRDPLLGGLRHHHHLHGLRAAAVPAGA
jgi:Cu/Ag efflux pump CusA